MKAKFTLIDYIIIILLVCAVAFAFIHIASDDSNNLEKTAFDESTINKIPDNYLKYYKDGFIVKSTVEGFNSTTGNRTTINGTVIWQDSNDGNDVKLLIESDNGTYLAGLYKNVPEADIYIDHISLESHGEKYRNLKEITLKPRDITSLKELTENLPDDLNCEITTTVSMDSLNTIDIQKITNKLADSKRISIKSAGIDNDNQLIIVRATSENINDANSILGNINAVTGEITIRIYDCDDGRLNEITKNLDVENMRNF